MFWHSQYFEGLEKVMEYVTEIRGILKAQKGTNVVKCRGFGRSLVNFIFVLTQQILRGIFAY